LQQNGLLQLHVRCKRKHQFDFALSVIDSINVAFKSARGRPIETISVEPTPESSLFTDRSVSASNSWNGYSARRVRSEGRADPCGNTSANRKWSRSFRRKSQANRSCLQRGKAGFTSLSRRLRAFTGQWNTSACTTPARMFYRLGIDPVC
jgi:hypothetical protein